MRSGGGDKLSRRIRFDPTLPVAPVIRSFILVLTDSARCVEGRLSAGRGPAAQGDGAHE